MLRVLLWLLILLFVCGCTTEAPPATPVQAVPGQVPLDDQPMPPPAVEPATRPAEPTPQKPGESPVTSEKTKPALNEREKIERMLSRLEKSDAVFIRAGVQYGGKDAAAHLRGKWSFAGSRIKTADEFITHLASRSSASGKPYQIQKPDGTLVPSEGWFRELLQQIENE